MLCLLDVFLARFFSRFIALSFVCFQSVYEDIARDTNRGHTVAAVKHCFGFAKDCGMSDHVPPCAFMLFNSLLILLDCQVTRWLLILCPICRTWAVNVMWKVLGNCSRTPNFVQV